MIYLLNGILTEHTTAAVLVSAGMLVVSVAVVAIGFAIYRAVR